METQHIFPDDDIEPKDEDKLTVTDKLCLAAGLNDFDEVKRLIEVGENGIKANVNYGESTNNLTALNMAINYDVENDHLEIIKYLIKAGADVNLSTNAVNAENLGREGAQTSAEPQFYPLHYAVRVHNPEIVKLLLANGADPYALNSKARTPLDDANELKLSEPSPYDDDVRKCLEEACKANPISEEELARRKKEKLERVKAYCTVPKKKESVTQPQKIDEKKNEEKINSTFTVFGKRSQGSQDAAEESIASSYPDNKNNKRKKLEDNKDISFSAPNKRPGKK